MTRAQVLKKRVGEVDHFVKNIESGKEIEQLLLTNDQEMVDKAYVMLHSEMHQYQNGKFKKWICVAFGIVLALAISAPTILTLRTLLFARYDRSGLESVAQSKFTTGLNFSDVETQDPDHPKQLLIPSFEFNQNQPRFFSQYFNKLDPAIYELPLWEAVAASSSAPIYFDPTTRINGYGFQARLIDGGIICNNPSLYAYYYARYLLEKPKVRIISLGTGNHTQEYYKKQQDDKENDSTFKWSTLKSFANFDWMMNFDSVSSDKVLGSFLNSTEYVRANVPTEQDLDTYSSKDIKAMKD